MSREKLPGWTYTDGTDMGADSALLGQEALGTVRHAQSEWQKAQAAGDQEGMDHWHGVAESERAKAGYSGGANGGGYIPLSSTVKEPDYGEAPSEYKAAMDKAIQALQGRQPFRYDPESDPSYQQYAEQYTRLGKQAMEDSYGHAALRTGGLGGSAAMSASQQAYNGYMQALADKIPELRQIAYQMWQDEEDRLRRDVDLYGSLDQQAWNRWNSDRSFQRGAFEGDRDFDYNKGMDQWNMVRQLDRDAKTDAETEYQRGQDAKDWAWKENERDYSRGLEKAAGLATVGDYSGYAQLWDLTEAETEALVAEYAEEKRLTKEQAARDLADWYAEKGDFSKLDELNVDTSYLKAVQRQALQPKSSGGSGGGSKSAKPALTYAQTLKAIEDGNITDNVRYAYEYYMGEPLEDAPRLSAKMNWAGMLRGVGKTVFGRPTEKEQTQPSGTSYADLSRAVKNYIDNGLSGENAEYMLDQIDRALAAGTITQAQYDELGKKLGYQ